MSDVALVLRRYAASIVFLSLVGNLLVLALPLYSLQIYDRVLQSGSTATLLVLTVIVLPLTAGYGIMDYSIRRAGAGAGAALQRLVAPGLVARDAAAGREDGLLHLGQVVAMLDGNRFGHVLDLLWAPLFLVVLFFIAPVLAVISLAGIVLLVVTALLSERARRAAERASRPGLERGLAFWKMAVRQRESVLGNGALAAMSTRFAAVLPGSLAGQLEVSRVGHSGFTWARTLRMVLQVATLGVGARLAIDGDISGGAIVAASLMMSRAVAPVENCLSSTRSLGESWRALQWLWRLPAETERGAATLPVTGLRIRDLTHGPDDESTLFRDVTLDLPAGTVLTVLGSVGTGKSTLLRLLGGIDHPRAGMVVAPRPMGYASQQPHLFEGTVAENVALFRSHDAAKVLQAVRDAGVEHILAAVDGGLSHRIGRVPQLSGGQQQAICLARAFFGRPPVMVFDEPTARLDVPAEIAFAHALMAARGRGAVIVLATHSERLLRLADKLLVLRRNQPFEFFEHPDQIVQRLHALRGEPCPAAVAAGTG